MTSKDERFPAPECSTCPLSLQCLAGYVPTDALWCTECKGLWIDDTETMVRCDILWERVGRTYTVSGCLHCEPYGIHPDSVTVIEGVKP